MELGLWAFLSICVIFGVLFLMYLIFLNHKKEMKQLEIEALKYTKENQKSEVDKS